MIKRAHVVGRVALALCLLAFAPWLGQAASILQDANGFVVMEAEDFDLNVTQDTAEWLFDNTALSWSLFDGWGYMEASGGGGYSTNTSARMDFKVKFDMTGPHYLWVLACDDGGKQLHMGLDGVVTTNTLNLGGEDERFGAGELVWVGSNNTGVGPKWSNKSYLDVPSAVDHTVNVFISESGLQLDKIVLTTNIAWRPEPYYAEQGYQPPGQTDGGATNIPSPVIVGSPLLSVALTQPMDQKVFIADSNLVVTLAAKPVTNGLNSVTKMEFFATKQPSGPTTKLGETTARPYMVVWTNPATGSYELTAVVTDNRTPPSNVATSAVASVQITPPPIYLTPLVWVTNNFDTGLDRWTLVTDNHASGFITNTTEVWSNHVGWVFNWYFDLDWQNAALCGGSPGEFGGHVERMRSVWPYVVEPLARPVSLNEELWFRGRSYRRNYGPDGPTPPATNRISANSDTFLGYFDLTTAESNNGQPSRLGLKMSEPGGIEWRMRIDNYPAFSKREAGLAPETNAFEFELHWTPSGLGDGSGTMSGSIAGTPFTWGYSGANSVTFDAFGFIAVSQGNDEPWRQRDEYFDNLEYLVPAIQKLDIQLLSITKTLLSWAIPDHTLQYADGTLPNSRTNGWTSINTNQYVNVGGRYYYTNTIGAANRWFQLRSPAGP